MLKMNSKFLRSSLLAFTLISGIINIKVIQAINTEITIQAAGASFPQALYKAAFFAYLSTSEEDLSYLTIEYEPTGSGGGNCRIMDWYQECDDDDTITPYHIDFAGSDSLLNIDDYDNFEDLQMYPTVGGAVSAAYNIPVLEKDEDVILTTSILAQIFSFNITNWSDPLILEQNPLIAEKLSSMNDSTIKVGVKGSKSGTTEIFTSALANANEYFANTVGASSYPSWTQSSNLYYRGKSGARMASFISQTPNSIGYLVLGDVLKFGLSHAKLRKGDEVIKADAASLLYTVSEVGMSFGNNGDDEDHLTAALYGAKGDLAWPIAGYTYLVMRKNTLRDGATCQNRLETVKFWTWFYTSEIASHLAQEYGFTPLASSTSEFVLSQLHSDILCEGELVYSTTRQTQINFGLPNFLMIQFEGKLEDVYGDLHPEIKFILNSTEEAVTSYDDVHQDIALTSPLELDHDMAHSDDCSTFASPFIGVGFVFIYNVCGDQNFSCEEMETLALNAELAKKIFSREIKSWDNAELVALNPDFRNLEQTIQVVDGPREHTQQVSNIFERAYGLEDFYNETHDHSYHELDVIQKVTEIPYTISVVHYSQLIPSSVMLSRFIRPDGNNVVSPSQETIESCAADTYDEQKHTFDLEESAKSDCYPLSKVYLLTTQLEYFDDCSETSTGYILAHLAAWLLGERNLDTVLKSSGYVPLAAHNDDAYTRTWETLLSITCDGKSILALEVQYNYLPQWAFGFSIAYVCFVFVTGSGLICWLFFNRKHQMVRFSQPFFLVVLIVGCILTSSSLIPLSLDDRSISYYSLDGTLNLDQETSVLDSACTSLPWIYCLGFALEFSALFAKIWRLKKILVQKTLKRVKVTTVQMIPALAVILLITVIFCTFWQVMAPLYWERYPTEYDYDGNMVSSFARCNSVQFSKFFWIFIVFQVAALFFGIFLCYKTRNVQSEFMEGQWIIIILLNMTSTMLFSVILGVFMRNQPTPIFIVALVNVLMVSLGVMLLMMIPKIWVFSQQNKIGSLPFKNSTDNKNSSTNTNENSKEGKTPDYFENLQSTPRNATAASNSTQETYLRQRSYRSCSRSKNEDLECNSLPLTEPYSKEEEKMDMDTQNPIPSHSTGPLKSENILHPVKVPGVPY